MTTHSSILAWKIPWTGEPCWLQSMGSQEQIRKKKKKRKEKKILFFRIYEEQLSMITFLKILWYYFMGITMIYLINLLLLDI